MICVNSVSVYPKSISLKVGTWSYAAYAEVCPSNADCKEVQWHSDNSSVASVNASSGYICANEVGTAHIYATATDGSGCSDYLTVTVSNTFPVTSVTLNRSSLSLEEGQRASLSATVYPDNATNKNVNWTSSNNAVATVSCGVVTAVSKGSAKITATAADDSGCFDCCTVIVTGDIMVTNVSVSPSSKSLTVGATCYLYETVTPSNATNKTVLWSSSNTNVATVNPNSGLVTACGAGAATIYATAQDGSGKRGTCSISVSAPVSVTSINVSPKQKTLSLNETTTLRATVCPYGASGSVVWTSSDTSVATVGTYTGIVTAKSDGTTTITARAANGNKTDTATITVNSREKVIVKKDSHSFYVKFADGKVWKSIGIDLTNRQENYNQMYPPNMWYENYEYLIEEEQRFLDNYENFYSEKQFALLYLLDPFGVEYYLSQYNTTKYVEQFPGNYENYNDKLRAYLKFKDRIYKEIFGRSPTPFVLSNDGRRVNVTWSYDRIDVFTDSELIFGAHNIVDMIDLLERAVDLIIHLVDSILPDTTKNKWIMRGVNVAKTLLFSGSIVEAFSDVASDFLDDYIEDSSDGKIKIMEWPNPLLDNIYNFKKGIDEVLTLPNIHDIKICDKVNKQSNYNVEFSNGSSKMFVGEVLELCS